MIVFTPILNDIRDFRGLVHHSEKKQCSKIERESHLSRCSRNINRSIHQLTADIHFFQLENYWFCDGLRCVTHTYTHTHWHVLNHTLHWTSLKWEYAEQRVTTRSGEKSEAITLTVLEKSPPKVGQQVDISSSSPQSCSFLKATAFLW